MMATADQETAAAAAAEPAGPVQTGGSAAPGELIVEICGAQAAFACGPGEEARLRQLAATIDRCGRTLLASGFESENALSDPTFLLMAAMVVADELAEATQRASAAEEAARDAEARVAEIADAGRGAGERAEEMQAQAQAQIDAAAQAAQARADQAEEAAHDAQTRIAAAEEAAQAAQSRADAASAATAQIEERAAAAEASLQDANGRLAALEAELAQTRERGETAAAELAAVRAAEARAEAEDGRLRDERNAAARAAFEKSFAEIVTKAAKRLEAAATRFEAR